MRKAPRHLGRGLICLMKAFMLQHWRRGGCGGGVITSRLPPRTMFSPLSKKNQTKNQRAREKCVCVFDRFHPFKKNPKWQLFFFLVVPDEPPSPLVAGALAASPLRLPQRPGASLPARRRARDQKRRCEPPLNELII